MSKRYDLDVGKRRMRREWRTFVKERSSFRKDARILCFPGEYGFEIEQCYRPLGFRDENIFGVERDPSVAKAIRQRYPKINLFEGELVDFVRQYEGAPFSVVSLDYCGNFGADKIAPVGMMALRGMLAPRCVLAVNILAGREQKEDQENLRYLYARYLMDQRQSRGEVLSLEEAVELVNEASAHELADVRDNAFTQDFLATLGYTVPALRVSVGQDLTKLRGTAFGLRFGARVVSNDGTHATVEGASPVNTDDRLNLAIMIKHEAIQDIREELRVTGVVQTAQANWRWMGMPPEFFEDDLGRMLVMAFYDQYGLPDLPVNLKRFSYVSESGKRMISDFVETRKMEQQLALIETLVAPFRSKADPSAHRFMLVPRPEKDDLREYLLRVRKMVRNYHDLVAQHVRTEPDAWPARTDLGGGEAIPLNQERLKERVIGLAERGLSTEEIAQKVPYMQPGSIRAIKAHVTMRTYSKSGPRRAT